MRYLAKNKFGGYYDLYDPSFELSKNEAKWMVEIGKAKILDATNKPFEHVARASRKVS